MSMKNSNDTIGNRTRDCSVYSAVHQSTVPPGSSMSLPFRLAIQQYYDGHWFDIKLFAEEKTLTSSLQS